MELSFVYGLKKVGLPLVITSGELNNWCFLLDTGSTHNIIFSFVYEHFKDKFKAMNVGTNIMGIEGDSKPTSIVEGTFNFGGNDYTSTFCILDANDAMNQIFTESGIQIHGIIGTQFLIENAWVVDYKKFVVYENE